MSLFRLLRGQHAQGHYPQGHPKVGNPIVYEAGDIVESDADLLFLNGKVGSLGPKFEVVHDDRLHATDRVNLAKKEMPVDPASPQGDGLDSFTLDELKQLAEDDEVDLGKAKTKEQVIKAIREQR
jgi:hypothetical protein